ncbi:hypothetical protein CERZMDRAFT_92044 [Cercospora zeae-maydis SCOH1-5]|uniref:Carboxymuconolactone decarboxylase-like domain-containing protein n=1 Tax=Cercospora zeae-maydis SCOH1-5 TaxID=717836 RepID=A0A6A6FVM4_9PEZI|nr:hypothetical protein CERZMDRAFT_92044 [Cercospora zeae-maydis SCOH1-5]
MSSFPSAGTSIPDSLTTLFQSIESSFPSATLGQDKWYILALASLVSGNHPEQAAELYKYLTLRPEFSASDQRKTLVRRLRECLLKLVIVVGVIKPIEAVLCIAHVERPEDRDYTFSRENWSSGPENEKRGRAWLDAIYKHNHASTENILSCHKDFDWLSREITYGLFLSDHDILDPNNVLPNTIKVETQLTVLSGIAMQNLPRQTGWHLRGTRRIGVSAEDVETLHQCIESVSDHCGLSLDRLPRVKDVEHEVAFD